MGTLFVDGLKHIVLSPPPALHLSSPQSFAPTEAALAAIGAVYKFFPFDCTDKTAVEGGFAAIAAAFGSAPQVLVYNAGGGKSYDRVRTVATLPRQLVAVQAQPRKWN